MANFTAGTSFSDGVTNDVTAAKLNALVADAVPTSNLALTSTNGTIANFTSSTANITLGTIPTLTAGTTTGTAGIFTSGTITTALIPTGTFGTTTSTAATITTGTFGTTTSTAATITTGTIPTLTTGTTTSTNEVVTNGTITNLSATTSTFLGAITGSTNVFNIGSGQIYKDASGNVGIGTNSPSNPLHVASSNAIIRLQDTDTVGNGSNGISTWITFRDSANTQTGYFGFPADPNFYVWNITNSPMLFGTNNQERLRISNDGTILFAKSTTAVSTVGYRFDTNGESYFSHAASTSAGATLYVYSTGAAAYRFYVGLGGTVNATNTAIAAISDVRLKENIRDIDAGLNEILELKPRTFDWKEGKGANTKNARGFIAQEIEQVFPDLVDEWRDPAPEGEEPYKSVRQDLIPVLVKAIQELKSENDSLKSRVEALEVV
jgi:hypothetical protein